MMRYSVLGRPGSDLLFQVLRLSTIGAEDFDGRVRDGIGYRLLAITTRSAKDRTGIGDQDIRYQERFPAAIRSKLAFSGSGSAILISDC
jgi:hypothetical protein